MRGEICPENMVLAPISPDGQRVLPEDRGMCFSPQIRLTVPCGEGVFVWSNGSRLSGEDPT